jgi:hypothetical protein
MTHEMPHTREDAPVKLNPDGSLPVGDQVAARCEAGVLGMFVGGLIFISCGIIGITGLMPWLAFGGSVGGGVVAILLGLLGLSEGHRHDLPQHTRMAKIAMLMGFTLLIIGGLQLAFGGLL